MVLWLCRLVLVLCCCGLVLLGPSTAWCKQAVRRSRMAFLESALRLCQGDQIDICVIARAGAQSTGIVLAFDTQSIHRARYPPRTRHRRANAANAWWACPQKAQPTAVRRRRRGQAQRTVACHDSAFVSIHTKSKIEASASLAVMRMHL